MRGDGAVEEGKTRRVEKWRKERKREETRGLGIASCTGEHEPSRNNAIRGQPCLMRARVFRVPSRESTLLSSGAGTRA